MKRVLVFVVSFLSLTAFAKLDCKAKITSLSEGVTLKFEGEGPEPAIFEKTMPLKSLSPLSFSIGGGGIDSPYAARFELEFGKNIRGSYGVKLVSGAGESQVWELKTYTEKGEVSLTENGYPLSNQAFISGIPISQTFEFPKTVDRDKKIVVIQLKCSREQRPQL